MKQPLLYPELENCIDDLDFTGITRERSTLLQPLIDFIQQKTSESKVSHLNFICTHNSRRSQLAQIWAHTAAAYYGVKAGCYSGGVEVTAFNEHAVKTLRKIGFDISKEGEENPRYYIAASAKDAPVLAFSKQFDDVVNPKANFAAVMTCTDADQNCPFIPGAEKRISLPYEDPKAFDGTGKEAAVYGERSLQIATEMFYVFSTIK